MTAVKLSAEIRRHILSSIRAGAYPHVAAEAWGVSAQAIGDIVEQGEGEDAAFAAEVRQAHATARAVAETKVFASDPKLWLMHGPARDTSTAPGWAATVKPIEVSAASSDNAWQQPTLLKFVSDLLEALTSFPEARHRAMQAANAAGIELPALAVAA